MKRNIITALFTFGIIAILISCSKELSIENGKETVAAVGSLKDSTGNCYPDSVHGTFYNGVTPGSDTAFVEIKVNVQTAGSYSIKTDLQNGFMFADSGFFNATGINTIFLKPIGTPILQKPTAFLVSFDTSVCSFIINVQDSTGTGLGGGGTTETDTAYLSDTAWRFTTDAGSFNGYIDTALIVDSLGFNYLVINGYTASTGDTSLLLAMFLPAGVITPGSYNTSAGSYFYFTDLTIIPAEQIYFADILTMGVNVTINITSYDPVTNIVKGTFSGNANNSAASPVVISGGSFTAKVT